MLTEINSENKTKISQLLGSVVVCLDIVRMHAGKSKKIDSKIINNIYDLLLNEKYTKFRVNFVSKLNSRTTLAFLKHYVKFRMLPEETRKMTKDLILALHNCDRKFLSDVISLVKDKDIVTQRATANLLAGLRDEIDLEIIFDQVPEVGNYGGYGYGGYGYGGYGYGGYGYGGYGYGGYGYGGYGYGGYGYGGYGYGGYGYGGYGYGGYGDAYTEALSKNIETDLRYLQDEKLLELFQALNKGIRNNEGQVCVLKEGAVFSETDGKAILFAMQRCNGDRQQKMFCGIAEASMQDPMLHKKLKLTNSP